MLLMLVLQIINKINHFSVGFVNTSIIIINVYIGDGARAVTYASFDKVAAKFVPYVCHNK